MKIVVIGGGIAGMSSAYELINHHSRPEVIVAEAESELTKHATGRSAAQYIRNYGAPETRALTAASFEYLDAPPAELADGPLLHQRAQMTVARADQTEEFEQVLAEGQASDPSLRELSLAEAIKRFPPLRVDRFARAFIEQASADIDVAALHQSFLRGFRAAGGTVRTLARVDAARRSGESWEVETTDGTIGADLIVNAAGAWGDQVALRAGAAPVGLQPMRRTAFTVGCEHPSVADWPLVAPVDHPWYVKPDGAQLLCSPANENPVEAGDARPEELDIAIAIDRINADTTLNITSIRTSWAGLRTFAPDRSMVVGPDPEIDTFIWCVGQGGTGIQTAPAAGRLTADLAIDGVPRPLLLEAGVDAGAFSAARFRP